MCDILIKGVDQPIDSKIIMSINDKGEVCAYEIGSVYPAKSYKAIVIPPHGDLIDREIVVKKLCEVGEEMIKQHDYIGGVPYILTSSFIQSKDEFPTVIPESEVEVNDGI